MLGIVCAGLASGQTANVWLTTDNQSQKLQPQASVTFTSGGGGTNPVVVDETQTYQQIEGFGASFTDTTGYILNEVATPASRTNAMANLFTRNGGGIGLSFVRNPMGASDLARYMYSYDDLPSGQTDTNLAGFSMAHDQADIIPLLQQALQLNPQLKIMASPWSPPGWMRVTNSMVGVIGGPLLTGATNMSQPFANYFVKYIQAYQAAGITINYISLQNEPLYTTPDYPGLNMDATTQLNLLRNYVLPALAANNLTNTRVLVYDHNWDRPDYPSTVFSDATVLASAQVAGTAWHGYGGTPGAMLASASRYPTKGNYLTEHSSGTWVGDQVRFDFEEITHCMRTWAKSYVKWNLAANQNYGPNTGGCNTCSPLVYVNTSTLALSYGIEFYTMGHFSKFVLPGAYRIFSGNASGIVSAAFLNPDGSKALVAFNDTTNSQTFQVQWGNQSFSYTLASYAGATFTWTGTQTGGYAINPTNQIQASSFNSVSGLETEPTTDSWGGYDVGYANTGDYAVYQNVNFAAGFTNVNARIASAGTGGTLEFRLDGATDTLISAVTLPVTGGWQTWQTVGGVVTNATGLHNLYVVFKGGSSVGNLNWFQFGGAVTPTNHPPVLAAIANQTILAGRTLLVTNSASDFDVPSQVLTYGLLTAPSGAAINTNSGVFAWRPTIAQSPTTQSVAVVVSDTGVPVMSTTQAFTVTVNRPVRPTLTPAPVTNGQFSLMISGDAGPDYIIQTSTNLTFWSAISTSTPAAMPCASPQTNTTLFPFIFYRALLGP
ncbi:MAG: carbohydrate-binding protein [Verrucomicrobia bacterium]|nr:carbohydrate-binding protein [Verrucomicrobiota bacterium]